MFKSATIYQLTQATGAVLKRLTKSIPEHQFAECLPKQARSAGWVPPLGTGELLYETNGGVLFCLRTDLKEIPSSNIKHSVDATVKARLEDGQEVSPVDIRVLKEELIEQALPNTLAKISHRFAYIDKQLGMLIVDANEADADEFMLSLKKTLEGTPFKLLGIADEPCDFFTEWMGDPKTLGDAFELGDDCSLKHPGEGGTEIINVKHGDLKSAEMKAMLAAGKQCCRIALKHEDADFAITAKLGIRALTLSKDMQIEASGINEGEQESTTPSEFATVVTVYRNILGELSTLLGGWPTQELLDLEDEMQEKTG